MLGICVNNCAAVCCITSDGMHWHHVYIETRPLVAMTRLTPQAHTPCSSHSQIRPLAFSVGANRRRRHEARRPPLHFARRATPPSLAPGLPGVQRETMGSTTDVSVATTRGRGSRAWQHGRLHNDNHACTPPPFRTDGD